MQVFRKYSNDELRSDDGSNCVYVEGNNFHVALDGNNVLYLLSSISLLLLLRLS